MVVLFGLAIVLLPFNDMPYLRNILREMAYEGAFYPLCAALGLWGVLILKNRKLEWPRHLSAQLVVAFFAWMLVSSLANLPWIAMLETKGRVGPEKLLMQLVLIGFVMAIAFLTHKIASGAENPLSMLRRFALVSFLVAGGYSIFEIALLLGQDWASPFVEAITHFIRDTSVEEEVAVYIGRIRSVSGEPSWFAMYCSFILPWVFSYVFTERKRVWFYLSLVMYLALLILLSSSRTAYAITLFQVVVFLGALLSSGQRNTRKSRAVLIGLAGGAAGVVAIAAFQETLFGQLSLLDVLLSLGDSENVSNIGRIGSQAAAYAMAWDHPIFGVGLGQYGFHMAEYVPAWARISDEIQIWMSPAPGSAWAPAHSLYPRIAAELGLIGLGLWIGLWAVVLVGCYRRYRRNGRETGQHDTLGLALIVSMIGVLFSGFNADSLRFFGYWILLGISWAYMGRGTRMGGAPSAYLDDELR